MDQDRFDGLTRVLGAAASRRSIGRSLVGGGFGAFLCSEFGSLHVEAKKKRKKKSKQKKKKPQAQPLPTPQPLPTSPTPVLTYQCPGPKTDSVSGDGAARFAQAFTAERSGSLRQIQFSIGKKPATTGDYLVQLLRVIGGKPSHNPTDVLAAISVPDSAVATGSDATLTATFAGPALVAGTEYAVAWGRPGSNDATANSRKGDGSACGGKWFIADGAGVFNEAVAQDSLVSVLVI